MLNPGDGALGGRNGRVRGEGSTPRRDGVAAARSGCQARKPLATKRYESPPVPLLTDPGRAAFHCQGVSVDQVGVGTTHTKQLCVPVPASLGEFRHREPPLPYPMGKNCSGRFVANVGCLISHSNPNRNRALGSMASEEKCFLHFISNTKYYQFYSIPMMPTLWLLHMKCKRGGERVTGGQITQPLGGVLLPMLSKTEAT